MEWVLVLVVFFGTPGGAGTAIEKIEFQTEKLCNEASAKLNTVEKDNRFERYSATCVKVME